jgi:hypothetical protein
VKSDIYVGFFLFVSDPARTAAEAPAALFLELGHDRRNSNCSKGFHILSMTPIRIRKPGGVGAEIINVFERKVGLGGEHFAQRPKIGPLKMPSAGIFDGVV